MKAFRAVYLAAHFSVGDLTFKLSPLPTQTELFGGQPFTLITAHNPRGELLSDAENTERHARLIEVVAGLGLEYHAAVGKSADSTWQEQSLAVFGLSLERAVKLGRQFSQNAILFGEASKVGLAWCESGEVEWCYAQLLPG